MILKSPEPIVETDICIVGGGPAAISIALELIKTDVPFVLLVGGGLKRESDGDRDLNRGVVAKEGAHERLEENRRRQFGGASVVWGGRCVPFDQLDFTRRSWVKHSGWPIAFDDLASFYPRALELCQGGATGFDSRVVFPESSSEIIAGMDNEDLESWHLERWSPPTNFAELYRKKLQSAKNLRILLNSHLLSLESEKRKGEISVGHAINAGRRFEVRAKTYVLAAGGIETPRILLSSRGPFHPNGVGNDLDLVGRFYMCHLNGTFALVAPVNRSQLLFDYERDRERVYCRRRWWITEAAQRRAGIGNIVFFLDHPFSSQGHRNPLFSAVAIAKALFSAGRYPNRTNIREFVSVLKEHAHVVLDQGPSFLLTLWGLARARFLSDRRLPSVLPPRQNSHFGLYFQAEQVPNPESRVRISLNEFDANGMPRAVVDLIFDELDTKTVVEAHRMFVERFRAACAGEILCDPKELLAYIRSRIQNFNSAAHHLGTTRIATSPEEGVVDENCKVHGIDNLFIAGSSVFPTGGHANPTLTIIALAIRMGDHLKGRAAASQQISESSHH